MTDPISDMLTRIRNAAKVHKASVEIPYSRMKLTVANLLAEEGYILRVEKDAARNVLIVELRYAENKEPVFQTLKRISKPGHRVYKQSKNLPVVLGNFGIALVSTSRGIMTNKEARKRRLGGEILCEIY